MKKNNTKEEMSLCAIDVQKASDNLYCQKYAFMSCDRLDPSLIDNAITLVIESLDSIAKRIHTLVEGEE